jgi:hypothetical protein
MSLPKIESLPTNSTNWKILSINEVGGLPEGEMQSFASE